MDLAFYTYFYGSDKNKAFMIPEIPSLKYACYFFTNNKQMMENLKNTKWITIYDDKPTTDDLIESCMAGKHVKVLPHEYKELKDYSYLCFLDTKLDKVSESFVEDYIDRYFIKENYALLLREHWFISHNVWDEQHVSTGQERYRMQTDRYIQYIYKQINRGFSSHTEHHCACGFLIRNMKHEKIKEINNIWYEHILECGIQDQISFFFVKQLFMEYIYPFKELPFVKTDENMLVN
jgi:hypothetical protein